MTWSSTHDTAVDRLASTLTDVFADTDRFMVLSRVRCQLHRDFPTAITAFDVVVVQAGPTWMVHGVQRVLSSDSHPWVAVNVVASDTLDEDFVGTPNTLRLTSVLEYVVFDPTGDNLRPRLQTVHKGEDGHTRGWPAMHGTYFSHLDFRLDVQGELLVASRCGHGMTEEELFVLRWELSKLPPDAPDRAHLERRIRRIEPRLSRGRMGPIWETG